MCSYIFIDSIQQKVKMALAGEHRSLWRPCLRVWEALSVTRSCLCATETTATKVYYSFVRHTASVTGVNSITLYIRPAVIKENFTPVTGIVTLYDTVTDTK